MSFGIWATCAAVPAFAAPVYQVTRLGDLGPGTFGTTSARAYTVNASGAVGGSVDRPAGEAGRDAVRWPAGGTTAVRLDNLGVDVAASSTSAQVNALNIGGDAVGYASLYTNGTYKGDRAVRWNAGGTGVVQLDTLGIIPNGFTFSTANAINKVGDAYGRSDKIVNGVSVGSRAVRWGAGQTGAIELANLGTAVTGVTIAGVNGVNNAGHLVGEASLYIDGIDHGRRPVRWNTDGTQIVELPNLGTDSSNRIVGGAAAINGNDVSVGIIYTYTGDTLTGSRAVRWSADGTQVTELLIPVRAGADRFQASASAINLAGDTVGGVTYLAGTTALGTEPIFWPAGQTTPVPLNTLIDPTSGWTLLTATAINDAGVIVGSGYYDPNGSGPIERQQLSFRLDPVPEPAFLSALVFCAVGLARRRRITTRSTHSGDRHRS
ncbi:MAG: extracellular repeat protein family [Phycisphaerales bacterium]|nr:extracellular repeat protein family [Phycisphaerales bacterium]